MLLVHGFCNDDAVHCVSKAHSHLLSHQEAKARIKDGPRPAEKLGIRHTKSQPKELREKAKWLVKCAQRI